MSGNKQVDIVYAIAAFISGMLGLAALGVAAFNLVGVPMIEANMMDPGLGWFALVTVPFWFFGAYWLWKRTEECNGGQ